MASLSNTLSLSTDVLNAVISLSNLSGLIAIFPPHRSQISSYNLITLPCVQIVDIAKVDEIPAGKTKHVEVNGKEIMIANMNGKFYAIDDRCAHMNAPLSMGNLTGDVVTCPFHGAKFNITSGDDRV